MTQSSSPQKATDVSVPEYETKQNTQQPKQKTNAAKAGFQNAGVLTQRQPVKSGRLLRIPVFSFGNQQDITYNNNT